MVSATTVKGYPKIVVVKDGSRVTLRPMVKEDQAALHKFFSCLSDEERWFFKEDVTDPKVIEGWVKALNYERVLPIVAEVNGQIVGDATLHRRAFGAMRHLAKVRISVCPEYRNKGLGTWMMLDIINLAMHSGIEKLIAELVAEEQAAALDAARRLGFIEEAVISNYAKDPQGKGYDLIIMTRSFYHEWGNF